MDVLLIEDEQKIADFVIAGFAAANIATHHELDGFRGLNTALIKTFDAIVLLCCMLSSLFSLEVFM